MTNTPPISRDLERRLTKADCHAHTFGRCVYKHTPEWHDNHYVMKDEEVSDEKIEERVFHRLKLIEQNINQMSLRAQINGLLVQCITEHPQFGFYGIPFARYMEVVKPLIEKIEIRHPNLRMPWGLELDLVINSKDHPEKKHNDREDHSFEGLNLIEQGNEPMIVQMTQDRDPRQYGVASWDMICASEILVAGVHEKYFTHEVKYAWDYHYMLESAVRSMGNLKQMLEQEGHKDKVYTLAHPFYCLSILQDHGKSRNEALLFNSEQNESLARLLIEHGVLLEFNTRCAKKDDELSARFDRHRRETTLMGTYIDLCIKEGIDPVISIGTDAHRVERYGKLDVSRLAYAKTDNLQGVKSLFTDAH